MLEIGSLVDGKYKILNKVGQGGMSVVYLAMNEKANKQWAIKEVRKDGVLDFEAVKQGLVAETDILKKLNHPNLPSIIDVIDQDDSFIIIMDYIQGNSLAKALNEYGALPQDKVIEWAKQLCDVLGYLHSRKPPIIYRDMKPANVMLKPDGNVTLIDFGTAREFKERNLADTTCLGTIGYAAPEQFGGMGQTDGRTDIYCLGATLYHLVTGMNPCEPPYEIKPIREINPALSSGLEKIILKCTQRDPNDRYQSAEELMYALEHYDEIDDLHRKKQKRKLGAFISSLVFSVLFLIAGIWGYFSAEQKKKDNYDYILAHAETVQDYFEAIATDPSRTEAFLGTGEYKGLINFLIQDGLTGEENGLLKSFKTGLEYKNIRGFSETVNAYDVMKKENPAGCEQVCYELGEAVLFYYDVNVEKDKYAAASYWFVSAKDSYPVAEVYCAIDDCIQKIEGYKKAKQFAKESQEYKNLWDQLVKLNSNAGEFDEDVQVRVWNEIIKMINNNASEFCDVTSKEEVLNMIKDIQQKCSKITNTFLQTTIEELNVNVEDTITKVNSVKK